MPSPNILRLVDLYNHHDGARLLCSRSGRGPDERRPRDPPPILRSSHGQLHALCCPRLPDVGEPAFDPEDHIVSVLSYGSDFLLTDLCRWNVTTGSGCITSSYAFSSYVEEANADALGPCSLSLYTGPECTGESQRGIPTKTTANVLDLGDVTAATRTSYEDCIPDITSAQSFLLACGP